ncbi:MAG: (2Fe-2S) ferredoxin domain-containing protein [Betaproteobacteria bacterium]|jgi:(2Fe-2S) ferredoxin|nr:(2Fe-2S) ferredoxin domain-containing protein [Betaproteobacteria bacterium]
MSYFTHHVFFCTNQREAPAQACESCGASQLADYAKQRVKALKLNGQGRVRINRAGCLDRCDHGPVMVVYPEGVWYSAVDTDDVEEIIQSHLLGGVPVSRLLID